MPADQAVQPLAWSVKPLLLPSVAVQLVLGAKVFEGDDGIIIAFEGAQLSVHSDDFSLIADVAKRLKTKYSFAKTTKGIPQTVVLAMAADAGRLMADAIFKPGCVRILYYPVLSPGSAFYRCLLPALALNKGAKAVAHVSGKRSAREALEYDIVVLQIDHSDATAQFARVLQQMGKRVVFEIDDAFDAMEPWHPLYAQYSRAFEQERMRRLFKIADAVTVSTPALAERYADLNHRIEVIPNYIDVGGWPRAVARPADGLFKILWAGSPAHWGDLNVIAQPLFEFVRKTPDVRIVFFGDTPDLPDDIKARSESHPFVPFSEYPIKLAGLRVDAALAPLADCPFNLCKSPIKAFEYIATGYPVIASNVGPYRILGEGALLCSTPDEWRNAFQWIHDDSTLRRNVLEVGRGLVNKFDVFSNLEKIEGFYCSLKEK